MNKELFQQMINISKEIARFNLETSKMIRECKREIEIILKRRERKEKWLYIIKVFLFVTIITILAMMPFWIWI